MNLESSADRRDLFKLCGNVCNGTANDDDFQKLEAILLGDVQSRQLYIHYLYVHQGLTASLVANEKTRSEAAIAPRSPVLQSLGSKLSRLSSSIHSSRLLLWIVCGGLATYFVTVMALVPLARFTQSASELPLAQMATRSSSVATVGTATDVKWSSDVPPKSKDSSIRVGEPLKIDSGTIELELNTGTKLVVEGPAEWSVDGRNSVSLRAGKLMAHVPEQAIGFTVETPTAKIVDLGTEFDVTVSEAGSTDVRVLRGEIEVDRSSSMPTTSHRSMRKRLVAGQSIHVNTTGAGEVVNSAETPSIDPQKESQADSTRRSSGVGYLPVQGAMASSEALGIYGAKHLIDGSGLKGDSHGNQAAETMWHAAINRTKGEFVLFDLGLSRRLYSMKVWNFNDEAFGNFGPRSVKRAKIYTSTSGKWDPLKQPDEWKLVKADQVFRQADGTADYNKPDEVLLDGAEARYVAIVIEEAYGMSHVNGLTQAGVGLSEVQFFGERLKSTPSKSRQ